MKRIFLFLLLATVARGATYDYPVKTATNALSASKALTTDANGKAAASATTSTEIGYVSGVTSAIQTQLNAKGAATNGTFSGGTFTGATNVNSIVSGTLTGTDTSGFQLNGSGGTYGSVVLGNTLAPRYFVFTNYTLMAGTTYSNGTYQADLNTSIAVPKKIAIGKSSANSAVYGLDAEASGAGVIVMSQYSNSAGGLHIALERGATGYAAAHRFGQYWYAGVNRDNGASATTNYSISSNFDINSGGAEFVLQPSGNIGFGLIRPQYRLDLNGQARILGTNGMRFGGTSGATDDTVRISQTSADVLALTATTTTVSGGLTIAGTTILTQSSPPANASAAGTVGTIAWDADYIYICTAANTWKRVAISTW